MPEKLAAVRGCRASFPTLAPDVRQSGYDERDDTIEKARAVPLLRQNG